MCHLLRMLYKMVLMFNMCFQRPQVPVQTFTIMPQSPTLIHITYQGMYCLELRLRGGGLVSLRDAAYSRFASANVINEFTPTPGLKVCFVYNLSLI